MSEWVSHPSGTYRRVGDAIHVRPTAEPGVTNVYPVPSDPAVARLSDAVRELRSALASSKAAHKAVWDRYQRRGAWVFQLQGEKATLREEYEKARRECNTLRELNERLAHDRASADRCAEHDRAKLAELREEFNALTSTPSVVFVGASLVDDLKDTIVSQAREIARLKGESE